MNYLSLNNAYKSRYKRFSENYQILYLKLIGE